MIREELESAVTSKSSIKDNDEVELNSCVIKSNEAFNIPENKVSSLEKLDLSIRFAVEPNDFKKVFRKNRFCNVIEAYLILDYNLHDADLVAQESDLVVAMAKSIPNVKKLSIETNSILNVESFEAIISKCRKLEFLKLDALENYSAHDEEELEEVIPVICRNLQNLRFLQLGNWCMNWKDARYLMLHSQQLQAVLSYDTLNVRSTARMSEVAKYLEGYAYNLDSSIFDKICFY